MDLSALERAVLNKLLEGEHPVLASLRHQYRLASIVRRELTGVGFFAMLSIPSDATPAPVGDLKFGDVIADIRGLQHGAGFVLFVKGGRLHMLEGFSFDEPWPHSVDEFTVRYRTEPRDLATWLG